MKYVEATPNFSNVDSMLYVSKNYLNLLAQKLPIEIDPVKKFQTNHSDSSVMTANDPL
jgi:hypothetical protein